MNSVFIQSITWFPCRETELWDTGTQTEEHMHKDMTNFVVLQHWIKLFLLQWEQTGLQKGALTSFVFSKIYLQGNEHKLIKLLIK